MEPDLTEKILSACSGSILTSLLVTPLDVVKVRMQSQPLSAGRSAPPLVFHGDFFDHLEPCDAKDSRLSMDAEARVMRQARPRLRGTLDGMKFIVENEGFHNLWRGLLPTLYLTLLIYIFYEVMCRRMMAIPATVVYFVGYETLRTRIERRPELANVAPVLAGSTARVLAASMISPLELVRTNMQHLGRDGSIRIVFGQVLEASRSQGISVLFKGLIPTLWRDVPFSAFYWASFEYFRRRLRPLLADQHQVINGPTGEFAVSFLAGGGAGVLAAIATTPFDVAKTRKQIQLGSAQLPSPKDSMFKMLRKIWAEEGVRGLTAGLVPRICKVAPACAIMIGSYEFGKAFFRQHRHEHNTQTL